MYKLVVTVLKLPFSAIYEQRFTILLVPRQERETQRENSLTGSGSQFAEHKRKSFFDGLVQHSRFQSAITYLLGFIRISHLIYIRTTGIVSPSGQSQQTKRIHETQMNIISNGITNSVLHDTV